MTTLRRAPAARLDLVCLPYAGGSSAAFRPWRGALPDTVSLHAAELPGRTSRLAEQPLAALAPLVEAIGEALHGQERPPVALFGHSMGAFLAFELARHLRARGAPEPAVLIVSGCRAPQLPPCVAPMRDLPDPELIDRLRELGGTPPEALADAELLELVLPALRADLTAAETYTFAPDEPLGCPICAFAGDRDRYAPPAAVAPWREQTSGPFALDLLPGGHFFLRSGAGPFLERLSTRLAEAEQRAGAAA